MFDFEFDNQWDVDKTADSLNTSLFGKSKKQKAKAANSSKKKQNELHTSVIHDSDDEKYSKKGKKKLKERRRKKNKQSGIAKSEGSEENTSFMSHVADHTGPKDLENDKKMKKKNKKQKIDATQSSKADEIVTGKTELKFKKQKRKFEDGENAEEEERHATLKKKDRKRKRSMFEGTEADGVSSKTKRAKLDGNLNESTENENVDTVKKKRKRNRKKKNNSKKNKYKHLALNSNKTKESNDSNAKSNEDIPQVINQNKQSQIEMNGKEKKKTPKKAGDEADSNQEKDKSASPVRPLKKATKKRKKKDETSSTSNSEHDAANRNNPENPSSATPSAKKSKQKKKSDFQGSTVGSNSNKVMTNGREERKSVEKKKKLTSDKPNVAVSTLPSSQSMSISNLGHMNAQQFKLSKAAKLKQLKLARMLGQYDNIDLKAVQNTNSPANKTKKKTKQKENDSTASEIKQQMSPNLKSSKSGKKDARNPQNSTSPFAKAKDSPSISSLWGKGAEMGLQAKEKLDSARFRYINEQLYSCKGSEAWELFREDPDAFQVYHQGFENQVNKWSVNPLNVIIKHMKDKSPKLVVADFGCGDAKLAESIPQKVHSFDLVALSNKVTVCDISKTPLPSESVDIGVFCLSLMGTNISDYILEANRVLKTGGLLKIAEVVSRFSGVSGFIAGVCKHGFQLLNKRDLSEMFYLMDFKKLKPVKKSSSLGEIKLKPCIYKKR